MTIDSKLQSTLKEIFSDGNTNITVLTGAGISAESGIPTFTTALRIPLPSVDIFMNQLTACVARHALPSARKIQEPVSDPHWLLGRLAF